MLLRNEWDDDIVSSDDFWEMNDELTAMCFLWNECGKFAFDWYDFWKIEWGNSVFDWYDFWKIEWGNYVFDWYDFWKIEWGNYVLILLRKMQQPTMLIKAF